MGYIAHGDVPPLAVTLQSAEFLKHRKGSKQFALGAEQKKL